MRRIPAEDRWYVQFKPLPDPKKPDYIPTWNVVSNRELKWPWLKKTHPNPSWDMIAKEDKTFHPRAYDTCVTYVQHYKNNKYATYRLFQPKTKTYIAGELL